MLTRKTPLKSRTPLMRGSRIRPVSKKRVYINRVYSGLRRSFLANHPWCMVWLIRNGYREEHIDRFGRVVGVNRSVPFHIYVPSACDIHHVKGRGKYLLATATWLSASRAEHEWVHSHQGEARKLGLIK